MNVVSSTELELVSITNVLGMILWCKYFMEAQGYTIESNLLYQDNKSTILLAENRRMSAGKNSKHIMNNFFLDKVAQGVFQFNTWERRICGLIGIQNPFRGCCLGRFAMI